MPVGLGPPQAAIRPPTDSGEQSQGGRVGSPDEEGVDTHSEHTRGGCARPIRPRGRGGASSPFPGH